MQADQPGYMLNLIAFTAWNLSEIHAENKDSSYTARIRRLDLVFAICKYIAHNFGRHSFLLREKPMKKTCHESNGS